MIRAVLALAFALASITGCTATEVYAGADFPLVGAPQPEQAGAPAPTPPPEDAGAAPPPPAAELDAAPPPEPDAAGPAPITCTAPAADCDGNVQNGCETDLRSDAAHCGACGRACTFPDCACVDGELATVCAAGFADCDGDDSNGCEVDVRSSMQHCGACDRTCHTNGHDAITATCNDGRCELICQFQQLEVDCDFNPDNGCETYLTSDSRNCGACGVQCSGTCRSGRCL